MEEFYLWEEHGKDDRSDQRHDQEDEVVLPPDDGEAGRGRREQDQRRDEKPADGNGTALGAEMRGPDLGSVDVGGRVNAGGVAASGVSGVDSCGCGRGG